MHFRASGARRLSIAHRDVQMGRSNVSQYEWPLGSIPHLRYLTRLVGLSKFGISTTIRVTTHHLDKSRLYDQNDRKALIFVCLIHDLVVAGSWHV